MRLKQIMLGRFVVAVFVTLALTLLPLLSQQVMAGHHVNDEMTFVATTESHGHPPVSCAEKSDTQSSDMQMNCCDMNCTSVDVFEVIKVPAINLQVADYFETDAEQLTSSITFGLMRPPRA